MYYTWRQVLIETVNVYNTWVNIKYNNDNDNNNDDNQLIFRKYLHDTG